MSTHDHRVDTQALDSAIAHILDDVLGQQKVHALEQNETLEILKDLCGSAHLVMQHDTFVYFCSTLDIESTEAKSLYKRSNEICLDDAPAGMHVAVNPGTNAGSNGTISSLTQDSRPTIQEEQEATIPSVVEDYTIPSGENGDASAEPSAVAGEGEELSSLEYSASTENTNPQQALPNEGN